MDTMKTMLFFDDWLLESYVDIVRRWHAATPVPMEEPSSLPGYRFEDCKPLRGDQIQGDVRWKRKRDLDGLIGRPIRLQVRLLDARLYSIRLDCGLWYACTPKPLDRVP